MSIALTASDLIKSLDITPTDFPIVLQSKVEDNLLVKFTSPNEGVVLQGTDTYPVGYTSNTWEIETFKNI